MPTDKEIFQSLRDTVDLNALSAATGLDGKEIDAFFNRVEEQLWRTEVKAKGGLDFLRISVDGASRGNPGPAAAGVVLTDAEGTEIDAFGRVIGRATNNVAEYRALIFAIERAAQFGAKSIKILTDSELMERQVNGVYRVKNAKLIPLFEQVKKMLLDFDSWEIVSIPRKENAYADSLANQALDKKSKV